MTRYGYDPAGHIHLRKHPRAKLGGVFFILSQLTKTS